MKKCKIKAAIIFIYTLFLFSPLFAQVDKSNFSKVIENSELIIHAKVKTATSRWINDNRGKHIYTNLDLEVLNTVKGGVDQKNISLEIIGGKVGGITETVSGSFKAKTDDELILFLQQNPLRVTNGNKGIIRAYNEKIFLDKYFVTVDEFLEAVSEISKNNFESKSLNEIEKTILQKRIKSETAPADSAGIGLFKKNVNENSVTGSLALPNLLPYKPPTWSNKIVVKKTTINDPDTQLSADSSPLYDSDELFLAIAYVNSGSATAVNFNVKIYVDNVEVFSEIDSELENGYYNYWWNISIGSLSMGTHSIKMVIDENNQITESSENDNQFTKNITVQHPAGTPLITSITPSIASAGTNTNITITGSGFGSTRGTSIVEFFYQNGEPRILPANYVSWSDGQVICDVPIGDINDYPASASSGPVTVTTSAGKSNGFNFNVSFSYGGVKWNGNFPKITYKINENCAGVTGEGTAVQSAMNSWSTSGAKFNFLYGGVTAVTNSGYDDENSIMFGSASESIATNYYWTSEENELLETDIVFNSVDNTFSTTGLAGTFDIESTSIHELGHSLSLRDLYGNADADKIMYGFGDTGEIKRELTSHEIEGIKYIYGIGGAAAEYTISGVITFNGLPIPGVDVSLTGSSTQSVTTSANGSYSFVVAENGNYTVTPEKLEYIFSPASKTFNDVTSNQVQDFSATLKTFIILSSAGLGGTITPSGNVTVDYGSNQTFQITANEGYHISQLMIDNSSSTILSSYTFTNVIADHSIAVSFAKNTYNLSTGSNPSEGGTTTGSGTFEFGTNVTVTAFANNGFVFTNWTEGTTVVSTNSGYSFVLVSDRSLTANFSIKKLNVLTSSEPPEGGTTGGGGNFESGTTVTVVASVNAGYKFTNWTEGTNIVSTNSSYSFVLISDRSLVANFSKKTNNILVSREPPEGGTAAGGGNFEFGTTVTVSASAGTGYNFINWTEGTSVVSTNPNYSFTITVDRSLVANFSKIMFDVSASCKPSAGGTITGTGSYGYGSSVSLTAIPNGAFKFLNWTENNIEVSADSNCRFIADKNRILVANFDRPPRFTEVIPEGQLVTIYNNPEPVWWSFQYSGVDDDGDEISFSLIEGPDGSAINENGLLTWSPTVEQAYKIFTVTVNLSDGKLSVIHSTTLVPISPIGAVDYETAIPNENLLFQNYPNPFNPSTIIKYALASESNIRVSVFNLLGQKVDDVFQGIESAGYFSVEWNSKNLPSGIYFYMLEVLPVNGGKPYRQNRKMIILK